MAKIQRKEIEGVPVKKKLESDTIGKYEKWEGPHIVEQDGKEYKAVRSTISLDGKGPCTFSVIGDEKKGSAAIDAAIRAAFPGYRLFENAAKTA